MAGTFHVPHSATPRLRTQLTPRLTSRLNRRCNYSHITLSDVGSLPCRHQLRANHRLDLSSPLRTADGVCLPPCSRAQVAGTFHVPHSATPRLRTQLTPRLTSRLNRRCNYSHITLSDVGSLPCRHQLRANHRLDLSSPLRTADGVCLPPCSRAQVAGTFHVPHSATPRLRTQLTPRLTSRLNRRCNSSHITLSDVGSLPCRHQLRANHRLDLSSPLRTADGVCPPPCSIKETELGKRRRCLARFPRAKRSLE